MGARRLLIRGRFAYKFTSISTGISDNCTLAGFEMLTSPVHVCFSSGGAPPFPQSFANRELRDEVEVPYREVRSFKLFCNVSGFFHMDT